MRSPARPIKVHRLGDNIRRIVREETAHLQVHKLPGVVDYLTSSGSNYFADVFLNGYGPKFQDTFADFSRWTTVSGSFTVASGVATSGGTMNDTSIVTGSAYTNLTLICQVNLPTVASGQEVEIIVRYQDANNYYALVFSNGSLILRKVSGGTATTLASAAVTFATGTWYWLRIQANGTRLTGWTSTTGNVGGWSNQIQATDSTFSSGSVGIRDVSEAVKYKLPTVYTGTTPSIPVRPGVGSTLSIGQEVFVEKVNFSPSDLLVDMARVI